MSEVNEFGLISKALESGLDLRDYSAKTEDKLLKAEQDVVQMFLENAQKENEYFVSRIYRVFSFKL